MAGNNNSGRKAKPDVMHRINGNPSKKSLGSVSDLNSGSVNWSSVNTMPDCPAFLDDVAQAKWAQLAPDLHALGLLTRLDADALAIYCQNYSLWKRASDQVRLHGEVILSPNGYPQMSAWVNVRNKAVADMLQVQTCFGLNPSARSKQLQNANSASSQPSLFDDKLSEALQRVKGNMNEFGLH